jgi:hypothetical protein
VNHANRIGEAQERIGECRYNGRGRRKRIKVMKDIAIEVQEKLLLLDVSDEALEVAASAAKVHASFTLGSCTGLSECPG